MLFCNVQYCTLAMCTVYLVRMFNVLFKPYFAKKMLWLITMAVSFCFDNYTMYSVHVYCTCISHIDRGTAIVCSSESAWSICACSSLLKFMFLIGIASFNTPVLVSRLSVACSPSSSYLAWVVLILCFMHSTMTGIFYCVTNIHLALHVNLQCTSYMYRCKRMLSILYILLHLNIFIALVCTCSINLGLVSIINLVPMRTQQLSHVHVQYRYIYM